MKENKTMNILVATFMVFSIANITVNLLKMSKNTSNKGGGCGCQNKS